VTAPHEETAGTTESPPPQPTSQPEVETGDPKAEVERQSTGVANPAETPANPDLPPADAGSAAQPAAAAATATEPVDPAAATATASETGADRSVGWSRLSGASAAIAVLLALLGFAMVVQLRHVATDTQLSSAREDDLVSILSDLEARETRLNNDITRLQDSQNQLASGAQRREAALADATRRADELGILAGTLPAEGPGMRIIFTGNTDQVPALTILGAVQELRNAGAEVMQIAGGADQPVRIVASTYFVDAPGGIKVDGHTLVAPYVIDVIGDAIPMRSSLTIFGGVVKSAQDAGGRVTLEDRPVVQVTARYSDVTLQYARPVS